MYINWAEIRVELGLDLVVLIFGGVIVYKFLRSIYGPYGS